MIKIKQDSKQKEYKQRRREAMKKEERKMIKTAKE